MPRRNGSGGYVAAARHRLDAYLWDFSVARELGIDVVSEPELVVLLCRAQTIDVARARVLLDHVRDVTAPVLVERAAHLIQDGERNRCR